MPKRKAKEVDLDSSVEKKKLKLSVFENEGEKSKLKRKKKNKKGKKLQDNEISSTSDIQVFIFNLFFICFTMFNFYNICSWRIFKILNSNYYANNRKI